MNPTCGSLQRDLIERVYIPKGLPNPNSHTWRPRGLSKSVRSRVIIGATEFRLLVTLLLTYLLSPLDL